MGVPSLAKDLFLAEGYTSPGFFDTYVLVANPGNAVAHVTYTFLRPSGGPLTTTRDIPPHSRGTIHLNEIPGLEATEVSTKISSDQPIGAERSMYFITGGRDGGHDAEGVSSLGADWYLADGYTGAGFDTYLLLANPNGTDAVVDLAYLLEDGNVRHQGLTVPAQSRRTVHVNDVLPGVGMSTHVSVTNGVNISVEQAMYFFYNGSTGVWNGGSDTQAVPGPAGTWYFAEGYTGQ
jgi:hypothetical protein